MSGNSRKPKINIITLGCSKNIVDSEQLLGQLKLNGAFVVDDVDQADIAVINTCGFIDAAKQESIDAIVEAVEQKQGGKLAKVVVMGCLSERYRSDLQKELPGVDAFFGSNQLQDVVVELGVDYRRELLGERVLTTPGHFAYLKISEGCDRPCSFCIIPKLRGNYRSRPHESILREAERLAARGVKELLLISQDTSFYGIDRQERGSLARLLRALNRVEGLEWIRMLYLYPTTIGDDVLDAMVESDKVCQYIDLPLQHASDSVLKRMKRPGTRASYEKLLDRIRTRVPGVSLRTTFVVGFPGETEADVAELEDFVKTVRFDHVGVFTYSHEEGTSAHELADDVGAAAKTARRNRLMSVQRRIVGQTQKGRVGQRVRLLVDGPAAEHELVLRARLESQAPDIDPLVYLTECDPTEFTAGQFIHAEVVGSRGYDLLARPVGPA